MTVLVTGSEGFIARNLLAHLKSRNVKVIAIDAKTHNIDNILNEIDFLDINIIYHLGAVSSTLEKNINKLYNCNVKFSIDLFEEAIAYNIPVVYTSSASIFGNTMKDDRYEYNPLNYYATTKTIIEMWLEHNINRFDDFLGLRLFNVYGADERKDDMSTSPIHKFKLQAQNEGVIKVFKGSENMIRDFISVDDVLKYLMCSHWTHKDPRRKCILDVGTKEPISFLEVAQLCSEKYNVPIKFIDMPEEMKSSYQYFTKSRMRFFDQMDSVESWLKIH